MNVLMVQDTKDGAILTVHIQPKASTTECVGIHGDAIKIRVLPHRSTAQPMMS